MIDLSELHTAVDKALLMGANQRRPELLAAASIVSSDPLQRVLEIGNAFGGTLNLWAWLAVPDAQVVGIDTDHGQLSKDFSVGSQQRLLLHEGDSRDPTTLEAVSSFLDGPLDFLFIDGAHDETVRSDFDTYARLVRTGGWIGFHDIVPMGDVVALWEELREPHTRHIEITLEPLHRMGIGLIKN